ncbi:hypothetical protein D3C78_718230 [compost metagenome]
MLESFHIRSSLSYLIRWKLIRVTRSLSSSLEFKRTCISIANKFLGASICDCKGTKCTKACAECNSHGGILKQVPAIHLRQNWRLEHSCSYGRFECNGFQNCLLSPSSDCLYCISISKAESSTASSKLTSISFDVRLHTRSEKIGSKAHSRANLSSGCNSRHILSGLQSFNRTQSRYKTGSDETNNISSFFILLVILAEILIVITDPLTSVIKFPLLIFFPEYVTDRDPSIIETIQTGHKGNLEKLWSIPQSLPQVIEPRAAIFRNGMGIQSAQPGWRLIIIHYWAPSRILLARSLDIRIVNRES